MSHHFQAKGGTHFNFNSDLSGDVRVHLRAADIVDPHTVVAEFPADDLLEFVDWYRRTPGYGLDEEAVAETLTDEERENLEHGFQRRSAEQLIAKVLRIHDALQARVGDLERKLMDSYEENRNLRARSRELEPL